MSPLNRARTRVPRPPARPVTRPRPALGVLLVGVLAAGLLSTVPAPSHAAATAQLKVQRATVSTSSITEGAKLAVTHAVQNRGRRKAGATTTRFYLTTNVSASLADRRKSRTNPRSSPTDILLTGAAAVGPLKPGGKKSVATVKVTVPVGTPAGSYTVLACADDRGGVKESEEGDNCTPASTKVKVKEAAGSGDLAVQSFSETYRWPDSEKSKLDYVKIFCKSSYPVKPMTLSAALTSTRAWLEKQAPGGLKKIDGSGLASTPEKAQELAASAVAHGTPGLALAALLKAHTLEPGIGTHLVNAAALAASLGLPNQAIAFLDAAAGRDYLRPALGIPHQATAAVIRGQALVMTGRYDAAQTLFAQAKQLAPLLSEADAGLATVAACKGQDALAARYLRRARIRSDEPVPKTPPTEEPERPAPNVDITRGKAVPLRQLPIAETPAQGVTMREVYWGIAGGFQAEIQANIDETNRLEQHLRDTDDARTRAEINRRSSLFVLLYRSHLEGEVDSAQEALDDRIEQLTLHNEEFWGGGTGEIQSTYGGLVEDAWAVCAGSNVPKCFDIEINRTCRPALVVAHNRWRSLILEAQSRANHYFEIWSKRMSGIAANLIDEEAHQLALLHIDGLERGVYALLVQQAQHWSHNVKLYRDYCVDPVPAEILNPQANEEVESPGACQGALKAMNFRAGLGPTTLKVSCERIEQSFSQAILPLLEVFADAKYDFRTGNVSFWLGSKGGGTVGNVVDAGFKSGIYVKADAQGDIVDVGWRTGPSVNVGSGSAEFGVYNDEIDISFTSSLTPGY